MRALLCGLCLSSAAFLAGCGPMSSNAASRPSLDATTETLKPRLESVAQTGVLGSGAAGMREAIKQLPADKSAALLSDYEALTKAKSRNEAKAVARRMSSKL